MNDFFQKDIISIRDLGKENLESIFSATEKIIDLESNQRREIARGKTLGYLFFEPNTRTRLSFQSAMALNGGTSLGIAEVMGMKITGFWAWILWRNYYLTKMPNLEKRIRVWLDWNIDLFSRIDISRYGFKRDTSKEYRELDEVDDVW